MTRLLWFEAVAALAIMAGAVGAQPRFVTPVCQDKSDLTVLLDSVSYSYHNVAKMRPRETFTATRNGKEYKLEAKIELREKDAKDIVVTADLSAEEWASIITVIENNKLLEWKAEPGVKATDQSKDAFAIKGRKKNAQSWDYMPKNKEAPYALQSILRKIAIGKPALKDVPFFRP